MSSHKEQDLAPEQIRAARGMLGWTRSDLAKRAKLSTETIKNTECRIYSPTQETIKAITDAFAQSNLSFISCYATTPIPADTDSPAYEVKTSYAGIICMTTSITNNLEATSQ